MSNKGWIGVDLDRTLATYERWEGPGVIGEPVPEVVEAVRYALTLGYEVRVFTARVSPSHHPNEILVAIVAIRDWTTRVFGRELKATFVKDADMIEVWDDRAVGVEPNTGRFLSRSRILPAQKDLKL